MRVKDKNNQAIQNAFLLSIAVGIGLSLALLVIAYLFFGAKEQMGAVIGLVASLIITLPTLVTAYWGIKGSFNTLAASVLGTWLVKMVAVIALVISVQNADWLNVRWVGISMLLGAVVPTLVEISLLMKHRPKLEV